MVPEMPAVPAPPASISAVALGTGVPSRSATRAVHFRCVPANRLFGYFLFIHEAGLFQGRLGFDKAILVVQMQRALRAIGIINT